MGDSSGKRPQRAGSNRVRARPARRRPARRQAVGSAHRLPVGGSMVGHGGRLERKPATAVGGVRLSYAGMQCPTRPVEYVPHL